MALLPGLPPVGEAALSRRSTRRAVLLLQKPFKERSGSGRMTASISLAASTNSHCIGGKHEFGVGPFGLNGRSSVLMRCMRSIFGRPELVVYPIKSRPAPARRAPGYQPFYAVPFRACLPRRNPIFSMTRE